MVGNLLKNSLRANAIFSALSAMVLITFSNYLSDKLGAIPDVILFALGIGLLGFTLLVLLVSEAKKMNLIFANAITMMDIGWVLGSAMVILLFSSFLSMTGVIAIVAVAVVVAGFAYYQLKGIKQLEFV